MIINKIEELRAILKEEKSIGFVPTMGYLHKGHLSLIEAARKENEKVVVSIFVNPTQFAPNEDFDSYPRDLERDYKLAMEAGADIIFTPDVKEMYPEGSSTYVNVEGHITGQLCGASRPTHFKGVTSVVTMLFNIVKPTKAYFGQKDAQQAIIIQKMVRDLHMDLAIEVCPIVREDDGLAMSSRNVYLSKEEREQSLVLSQSLALGKRMVKDGVKEVSLIKEAMIKLIETKSLAQIDYVDILDGMTLEEIATIDRKVLAAVAVKFGKTRLIDNCFLEGER